jgi:hypothetical protein
MMIPRFQSFVAAASLLAAAAHAQSLAVGEFVSDASGFDTKSFWVDTGKEIVVFDAQFTLGHA